VPEQHCDPPEQTLPFILQVMVTQAPLLHVVFPFGVMQQSEVCVQVCPLVTQVAAHTLLVHVREQQSVLAEQVIPSPEQSPDWPQVPPLLQVPEQHWAADVHVAPLGAQLEDWRHCPLLQFMEQHWDSPLHDIPLGVQPDSPHTFPLHS
jgi:hypothetical protein